jgi:hypothetical protein
MQNEHSRMTTVMDAQGLQGEIFDLNLQLTWTNQDLNAILYKNKQLIHKNTCLMNQNRDLKIAIALLKLNTNQNTDQHIDLDLEQNTDIDQS